MEPDYLGRYMQKSHAGAEIVSTKGIPLFGVYPGLKLNFIRPLFIRRLLEFDPDVIHIAGEPVGHDFVSGISCLTATYAYRSDMAGSSGGLGTETLPPGRPVYCHISYQPRPVCIQQHFPY